MAQHNSNERQVSKIRAASSYAGSVHFDEQDEIPKDPSNETVRDLRIIFACYENPTTSTITIPQLKEILELLDGQSPEPDLLQLELRVASQDMGEHLNFKNFVTFFISHMHAQSTPVRRREIFRYIDTDDSGELTCDELRDALSKMGMVLSHDEINAMVSAVEGASDGLISFSEFKKLYRRVGEIRNDKEVSATPNTADNRLKRHRKLHVPVRFFLPNSSKNTSVDRLNNLSSLFSDQNT